MQPKDTVDGAEFGGLEQARMCDCDRVQRPVELAPPERQEALQRREGGPGS
jgi:hypothetical protein